MRISIIGAGYVGLVTGICLASLGNKVILVDSNEEKVEAIRRGEYPVYEKGLEDILRTTEVEVACDLGHAIKTTEISFICVSTDTSNDGISIDLKHVKEVANEIGKALNNYHLVVVKSTVIPGTTEQVIIPLLEKHGKKAGRDFGICANPEFLREGLAVEDFMHPNRIVIGALDRKAGDTLRHLYTSFNCPIVQTDLRTAEMIKYASNTFLAAKVSLINELGNICKRLGIDIYEVAKGIGYDERIGNKFLNAGVGFGGSCLPKDVKALIAKSREVGYKPRILEEILKLNDTQPLRMIELLKRHVPKLKDKDIGVLGLAFKADTDDVRESRAIGIVSALLKEGARIKAYDPLAMDNFKKLFPQVQYTDTSGVLECEAIMILTDSDEFDSPNYAGKIVIDGRNVQKAREAKIYEGVCW